MKSPASLRKPVLATLVVALGAALLPAQAFAADEAQWVPGRLLVQPRAGLAEAEFDKIIKKQGGKQVGKIEGINVRIIQLPPQASEKAVEALLKNNKHLKFAERDMLLKPEATADDPYYASAWHLTKIGAPTAWDVTQGENVTIAILDSGVDATHPDLASRLVPGWNFYDNNSNTSDVYGHGTQVAGAAAAASNNALGVASVAGMARIMPIRVTDTAGMGSLSQMASGITWAADRGARVANLSFAAAGGYATVQNAAQYMKKKGGLVVTAAGNTGTAQTFAAHASTIVVSGTTSSDAKASWSSYGSFVDIAAPGASIWTTTRGGGYKAASGTSMATPVAAGVVGLMMASNPGLSAEGVESILFSTAVDLGSAGFDTSFGNGRVNASAAVAAAAAARNLDTSAPTVSFSSPGAGATVKGLVAVDIAASDDVGVTHVELWANGVKVATDSTAPYAFSWDSATVADGNVGLVAQAYDSAGNSAARTLSVAVANSAASAEPEPTVDSVAPKATISNPRSGSKVSGNVSIAASATDDVAVTRMQLFINNKLVSSANGANLSYRWNTNKIAAGTYTVSLEATDAAGNKGVASSVVSR